MTQTFPLVASSIKTGGVPVIAAYAPLLGGSVTNPATAAEQGLAFAENLFVDFTNLASIFGSPTTIILTPGQSVSFPTNVANVVSVNGQSTGHRFTGEVIQPDANFLPSTASFPPEATTTLTQIIPAYLYEEYNDDEDLQAFVTAYNTMSQQYLSWFTSVNLPVYTGLSGQLLDWVAVGLYGMARPVLPSGTTQDIGAFNTWALNTLPIDGQETVGPDEYFLTNDDVFKRILTWHLWKGDGKQFTIRWLKRRIMRFLTGTNGTAGATDNTCSVSVTFGLNNQVNINLLSTRAIAIGGALLNDGENNSYFLDQLDTTTVQFPISPFVAVFKAAVEAGVLELPFQYSYIVNVN